jgi:cell division transport system permease protein
MFIIASSLIILNLFLLISHNLGVFLENHSSREMIVYLELMAEKKDIETYKNKIKELLTNVETIKYLDNKEAFKSFKNELGKDGDLLTGLDDKIIPSYFSIKFSKQLKLSESLIESITNLYFVDSISYGKKTYNKIKRIRDISNSLFSYILVLIVLITIFTIYTTVKLTIYSRKDEIETLELVGATQEFIIFPFYIEGVLQGVLSSILSLILLYGIFLFSLSNMVDLLPIEITNLKFLPISYIIANVLITSILGLISSHISVVKFLKI